MNGTVVDACMGARVMALTLSSRAVLSWLRVYGYALSILLAAAVTLLILERLPSEDGLKTTHFSINYSSSRYKPRQRSPELNIDVLHCS